MDGRGDAEVGFVCRPAKPVTERFANKLHEAFEAMRTSGGRGASADLVPVKYRFAQKEPFDLFAYAVVDGAEKEIEPRLRARFDSAVPEVVKALAAERSLEVVPEDEPSRRDLWRPGVTRGWFHVQVLARMKDRQAGEKRFEEVVERALRGV